jgi:hypothetical protein
MRPEHQADGSMIAELSSMGTLLNNELKITQKETSLVRFELLSRNIFGDAEETHRRPQQIKVGVWQRFKSNISRIKSSQFCPSSSLQIVWMTEFVYFKVVHITARKCKDKCRLTEDICHVETGT